MSDLKLVSLKAVKELTLELFAKHHSISKMDIKAEKLSIIQQLLKVEDELLLASIQKLLDYGQMKKSSEPREDFWDELTESQKVQIEIARKQLRAGEGIPHKEVMAEFRKKYGA